MKPISTLSTKTLFNMPASRRPRGGAAMLLTGTLAMAPAFSFAAKIHVDPTLGSDAGLCGLEDYPCKSIRHVVASVSTAGDELYLVGSADFSVEGVEIDHSLSIHGTGATVLDANSNNRHFVIKDGLSAVSPTLSLQDMVLKNGRINAGVDETGNGGSIHLSSGNLRLKNVLFENNEAVSGGALWIENGTLLSDHSEFTNNVAVEYHGGAIYSGHGDCSLEIFDSIFSDNEAHREGGGIATNCATTVRRSDFYDNAANYGGAIQSAMTDDEIVEIRRTQFTGNSAAMSGGAIRVTSGAIDIRRSSFNENTAFDGGAIAFDDSYGTAVEDLTVVNSTFSSNTASWRGGAIATMRGAVYFVTMVDNWAEGEKGLDILSYGPMEIYHSLINHNPDKIDPDTSVICDGNVLALTGEGNLIDNDSCGANVILVGDHNYVTLDSLELNNGRTLSHKLIMGSAALDAAIGCSGPNGLNTVDQRGFPRPELGGVNCDIGAFER